MHETKQIRQTKTTTRTATKNPKLKDSQIASVKAKETLTYFKPKKKKSMINPQRDSSSTPASV